MKLSNQKNTTRTLLLSARPRTVHFLLWGGALIVLPALVLVGCKKEEVKNQQCESDCVSDLASEIGSCEEDTVACLALCDGPEDYECTWDCDDILSECMAGFYICSGGCPCATDLRSCVGDCDVGDETDFECLMQCQEGYTDCAGTDSPYLCSVECSTNQMLCKGSCDQYVYATAEFATCRQDCTDTFEGCLSDCK